MQEEQIWKAEQAVQVSGESESQPPSFFFIGHEIFFENFLNFPATNYRCVLLQGFKRLLIDLNTAILSTYIL